MITLRDYQAAGIDRLRAVYARGRRAPILVSPTGSGKSRCAAAITELTVARGNHVLVLAPRLEILGQLVRELAAAGIAVRSIHAEYDEGPADAAVTVASIWTLATARWRSCLPKADLIIIDECHRALAERSYGEVLGAYPAARILGLTATPARSDNRALGDVFDEIVVATTTAELMARGVLVPCRVLVPAGAEGTVSALALPVVEAYQQYAAGRLAIVFAASVTHATSLLAEFVAAGVPAGLVTGKTPEDERAETMRRFAAGEILVLLNVACFVEGLDVPACSVAILARKFTHVGAYLQALGRVLRSAPGKVDAIAIDLLGSALKHGPPDLPREYSLAGRGIRSRVVRDAIRQCVACGSIAMAGPRACAYCGVEYPVRRCPAPRSDRRGLVGLDGAPVVPREYIVTIVSKRRGACVACGGAIQRGDRIRWATVAKWARHERCPATAQATEASA